MRPCHQGVLISCLLRGAAAAALVLPAGCATRLVLQPANLEPVAQTAHSRLLVNEAEGTPETGRSPPLSAGMRLQPIGRIQQGMVLRPVNKELMVVGEDREEAFIVLQETTWVGYYLPFEKAFLRLNQPVALRLE